MRRLAAGVTPKTIRLAARALAGAADDVTVGPGEREEEEKQGEKPAAEFAVEREGEPRLGSRAHFRWRWHGKCIVPTTEEPSTEVGSGPL